MVARKSTKNSAKRKTTHADAVTEQLRSYATRGVFREFVVKQRNRTGTEYRFVWLTPKAVTVRYEARSGVLTLVDLLPDIGARSEMDRAVRAFIAGRFDAALPAHRRLSKRLIPKLVCLLRRRKLSVRLTLSKKDAAEGARQAVLLISEIFQNFLAGPYHEYMVRNFDLRED